jgi:Zn-dependent protease with chaperone function
MSAIAAIAIPIASAAVLARFHLHEIIWALDQLAALALPAFLLFTGLGARLRALCARVVGGCRAPALILFAALYLVLAALVSGAFDDWRDQPAAIAPWLFGELAPLLVQIVVAALVLWIPFALMRRFPRTWWMLSAAALVPVAFAVLVALPVVVDPLTTHYEPLRDKAFAAKIATLAARCGVRDIPVYVGGDDDTVVGLGPTKRIFLEEGIEKHETPDQITGTVGHELKHYVMGDNYKALAIIAALLFAGFGLVQAVGRRAIRRWHARFGFDDLADPASLPLAALILSAFWLAILPVFNWEDRAIEHEADRFGLELTHTGDANAALYAGWAKTFPAQADPFFTLLRATHPSLGARIRFAQTYRPWETGAPLVYGDICAPPR